MKIVVRSSANKNEKTLPKSVKETIDRLVLQISPILHRKDIYQYFP